MPLPISPLETSRLLLRPLCLDDAEQIQDIFPHWEVVQYMAATIPWPYPSDGALTYIRDSALPAMELSAVRVCAPKLDTIADFGWARRGNAKD